MRSNLLEIVLLCIGLLTSCCSASNQIEKLLQENENIETVIEIWGWGGTGGDFNDPLALDIKMKDDKRLFISYIRSKNLSPDFNCTSLGSPFNVTLVGDSVLMSYDYIYDRMGTYLSMGINDGIPIALIAQELKIDINTVEDVIKNYDEIYAFISIFPKKQQDKSKESEQKQQIIYTESNDARKGNTTYWQIRRITRADDPDSRFFKDIDFEVVGTWDTRIIHMPDEKK